MKTSIETSVIKTILSESTASALSALVALKETLAKIKKVTDEVPTLKEVAKAYGLQERTIKKSISYLINRGFLEIELIPSEWVSEMKGKITKDIQNVINIVTEAAINTEEPESVNDDVIVKVKAVNSITIIKKVYYLLPFIISNSYLSNEIVDKLDKDWLSRPLDKTRYKEQLKLNREFKKKQQELKQEKITVQTKAVNDNAIEVEAEIVHTEAPEAMKVKLNQKNYKVDLKKMNEKKQTKNKKYGNYNRYGNGRMSAY